MYRQITKSLCICLILTAGLAWALHMMMLYSFFDARTRYTVLICLALLFIMVWVGFYAEMREIQQQRKNHQQALALRKQQEQQLEREALQQAAQLLSQDKPGRS